jgi:acetyl-CoA synthetase (ADP-forming)
VALKIVSPEIVHKSDAGGVKLDLRTRQAIERAFKQIVTAVKKNHAGAQILGVSVQNMAPPGIEVMIGAQRDPQFGPVVVFGLGGIFVELFRDVSLRLIPIGRAAALAMIGELRAKRLLEGFRQYPPVDREVLAAILVGVSALMAHNPEIREMDLNPVYAYPDKALAVDARIILE